MQQATCRIVLQAGQAAAVAHLCDAPGQVIAELLRVAAGQAQLAGAPQRVAQYQGFLAAAIGARHNLARRVAHIGNSAEVRTGLLQHFSPGVAHITRRHCLRINKVRRLIQRVPLQGGLGVIREDGRSNTAQGVEPLPGGLPQAVRLAGQLAIGVKCHAGGLTDAVDDRLDPVQAIHHAAHRLRRVARGIGDVFPDPIPHPIQHIVDHIATVVAVTHQSLRSIVGQVDGVAIRQGDATDLPRWQVSQKRLFTGNPVSDEPTPCVVLPFGDQATGVMLPGQPPMCVVGQLRDPAQRIGGRHTVAPRVMTEHCHPPQWVRGGGNQASVVVAPPVDPLDTGSVVRDGMRQHVAQRVVIGKRSSALLGHAHRQSPPRMPLGQRGLRHGGTDGPSQRHRKAPRLIPGACRCDAQVVRLRLDQTAGILNSARGLITRRATG